MFYIIEDENITKALQQFYEKKKEFTINAEAFRLLFGAENFLIQHSMVVEQVVGLVFNPPKTGWMWTKPDAYGRQDLRFGLKKKIWANDPEYIHLCELWKNNFPYEVFNREDIYKVFGFEGWEELAGKIFSTFSDQDSGQVYLKTDAKLPENLNAQEVLGSVWLIAEQKFLSQSQ